MLESLKRKQYLPRVVIEVVCWSVVGLTASVAMENFKKQQII